MKILLYNPDNGITGNFMPHLWMFLLQSLTPAGHEVLLLDGNAKPMNDDELVAFAREQGVGLVGIGAMTRMIARAYRAGDALRAAGFPVVMGGPHVTELPDETLGRNGGVRHADAVALGEADETWPRIVEDAVNGCLKDVYAPVDAFGQDKKPNLDAYPKIPWESIDLDQFNQIPRFLRPLLKRAQWEGFHLIPIESGRGCPYGCEFCTVTGFFGDSIRFRTNESVVDEMLRLKARAKENNGKVAVFFVDDNFAINVKRTKSLLQGDHRGGRAAGVGGADQRQPSARRGTGRPDCGIGWQVGVHRDGVSGSGEPEGRQQELQQAVGVRRGAGAARQAQRVRDHLVHLRPRQRYAGRGGANARADPRLAAGAAGIRADHAVPFDSALHASEKEGRLTRPTHWLDFAPFKMAHTPLKMTVPEVHTEVQYAWTNTYSPENTKRAMSKIADAPAPYKISHLVARLCFRGIYFPQKGSLAWLRVLVENRKVVFGVIVDSFTKWRGAAASDVRLSFDAGGRW